MVSRKMKDDLMRCKTALAVRFTLWMTYGWGKRATKAGRRCLMEVMDICDNTQPADLAADYLLYVKAFVEWRRANAAIKAGVAK